MDRQRKPMKISARFSILIIGLFVIWGTINIILVYQQMRRQALLEAELKSQNILNLNLAIHTYFTKQLKPKLFELTDPIVSKDYFEPTWMSSTYAIREINKYIKSLGPADYYYKECAINARNPENEADKDEKSFLQELRRNPQMVVNSDIRSLQGKKYLIVMRRGETMEKACLICHGDPDEAPGDLVRNYGRERGFHRNVGDVVSAISIRVPLSAAYGEAGRFSLKLSGLLLMSLIFLFGVIYWAGRRWIFQPLNNIREKALLISTGSEHLGEEISLPAGRELYDLTMSFNKMSESLRLNRDHLEERIKERTEELYLSNERLKQEIQERLRKEEALSESEKRYRGLFEDSNDFVYTLDLEGNFTDVNKAAEDLTGYTKNELIGMNYKDYTPEDTHERISKVFNGVVNEGKPLKDFPLEVIIKDGTKRYFETCVSPLRKGEEIIGFQGNSRDVTGRKQAEAKLHESKRILDVTGKIGKIGGWEHDLVTGKGSWTQALYDIFEIPYDREPPGADEHLSYYPPQDRKILEQAYNQAVKNGTPFDIELQVYTSKKKLIWCRVQGEPIYKDGKCVVMRGTFQDITEHKMAEEGLRESEERFKAQYQGSPSPTFTWKKQGEDFVLIDFNDAAGAITDGKVGEFVGRKATELYLGRQELLRDFRRCYDQREVIRRETRSEHFVPGRLVVVTFAFVPPDLVLVHLEDITDRRQAEEEKDKLQSQLSNALEIAHLGPWEFDDANDLFTFNDHFYKIFRTTAEQVGGYTMSSAEYFRRFVHPDDLPVIAEEIRKLKVSETTDPYFGGQLEHRMLYADGTVGYLNDRFFIIKDAHDKTVKIYGVNQDITERKRMEEELLRVQKLESVGILAGGIAHDFNNILTAILGNVSLAKMQVRPEDVVFDLLSEAEKASVRAQTLTRQLLTFAKGGFPVKETASIKDIVKESSLFVLRGSKSRCNFSIAEDLWPAEVDVGQINQVINNVVINANQAMPEGGIIRVAAENLIIDNGQGLPLKPGRYIRISITDQGVGIAENHLLHIFDPYFTTKRKGSGLGLAVTYSIIKKHDGHITVESTLGESTTFHIYLPASEKAVPEKEEDGLIKGHGRILVMDDEESLRKMVRKMLKNLGYESEFAKDGAEALEMYKAARESGKPYDAVVLDLTVPGGMGGKDAIKKLFEIDPEVKAVVSSGYSDDPVLSNFREYGFKGILPKPFKSPSLGKVLRDVIRGEIE